MEPFQNILASAFVVQQSLLDVHWSSAIPEVRRLIASGALGTTGTMHLIAARARSVANAAGVAIALVTKDQLIYRAGSGIAAGYVGRHMMATLCISAKVERRGEILRVEDADTDQRIGGAICRQRGVKSLLILPVYHDQVLSGILEVFFSEPHAFQDQETNLYQLMAEVIAEALSHSAELPAVPRPMERIVPPIQAFPSNSPPRTINKALGQAQGVAIAQAEKLPSHRTANVATKITFPARRITRRAHIWKVADRGAVLIVLVVACWIAFSHRRPASPLENSAGQRSSAIEPQLWVPRIFQGQEATKNEMFSPQNSVPRQVRQAAGSTPRRVLDGDTEIDYISDDVTVRHFSRKNALPQTRLPLGQVEYTSADVTVWRFAPHTPAQSK